jgi:hypothetical protein
MVTARQFHNRLLSSAQEDICSRLYTKRLLVVEGLDSNPRILHVRPTSCAKPTFNHTPLIVYQVNYSVIDETWRKETYKLLRWNECYSAHFDSNEKTCQPSPFFLKGVG